LSPNSLGMTDEDFQTIKAELEELHRQDDKRSAFVKSLRRLADAVEDGKYPVPEKRYISLDLEDWQ
jgi:hypothetical protein